ncbi:MAG: SusC/RagA family TonB-linked outer membrane protein [Mangrovibacterium sp.]
MVTKGLSMEIKGAMNTTYSAGRGIRHSIEIYDPYYRSTLENPTLPMDDPSFDHTIVYKTSGTEGTKSYQASSGKARDWYLEASIRYDRKFGDHNVGGLVLYNQKKTYYPSQYPELPTAYVGLVGRLTYDYKKKYLAEYNMGYNGSENFAPDKRYGFFPAGSLGYVVTEENFMKAQKVVDYLKLRVSAGLVGNDNMSSNRYLYLPGTYKVNLVNSVPADAGMTAGYNFGVDNPVSVPGGQEQRLGNPNVTWEKCFKQNYGVDVYVLDSRLKITADYFMEKRKDILINRSTLPVYTAFTTALLPVTNMGKVDNHGYEVEATWNQFLKDISYWVTGNVSYAKNKIVFQDEAEPNYPYMWKTGHEVGARYGYVAEGFYNSEDFDANGNLVSTLPQPRPLLKLYPGDAKFKDLNDDGYLDADDQTTIGYSNRPRYTFGLNYGARWKNFSLTMSWLGTAQRDLLLGTNFYEPFRGENRSLMQFQYDERWTPETAETAVMPRFSKISRTNNYRTSTLLVRDGSYIRLRNMTLGYDFAGLPTLKQLGVSKLTVELTGYNLLTFDSFKIMDPESQPDNSDTYPVMKLYNLGLKVTF